MIGNALIHEMIIKFRNILLKKIFKDFNILHEQWKLEFIKAAEAIERNLLLTPLEYGVKEPESFLLVGSRHHKDESHHEIHALTVSHTWLVNGIRFKNIL